MTADSPTLARLRTRQPLLWINPRAGDDATPDEAIEAALLEAEDRMARSVAMARRLFPELQGRPPFYESELTAADRFYDGLAPKSQIGRVLVKGDHALPLAGSIKARGGFHEVIAFAERLALANGLSQSGDDLLTLTRAAARRLFSTYTISVGSTGNLGLSVGVIASALGFRAVVHMSSDAKAWKKQRLRDRGVSVVEHLGDYALAVERGREEAQADARAHFIDDERSVDLFVGYAAAARELQLQLGATGVRVDAEHPLLVHIPCGVGGAPGGIAYGLKRIFGADVFCFFGEPVAAPCMLAQLLSGWAPTSVYDVGLDNRTEADGLAVGQASMLAAALMQTRLAGVYTASDDQLFTLLARAHAAEQLELEPSAAMAFAGPLALCGPAGRDFRAHVGLEARMQTATQVVWTTGGALVPEQERQAFALRAERAAAPLRWT